MCFTGLSIKTEFKSILRMNFWGVKNNNETKYKCMGNETSTERLKCLNGYFYLYIYFCKEKHQQWFHQ